MYGDMSIDPGLEIYHGMPDLSYWQDDDEEEEEEVPEWRHKKARKGMVIRTRLS